MNIQDLDEQLLKQNSRIIHQIWFGTIPNKREARKTYDKLKMYRESWNEHNPDWFHMQWNKELAILFIKTFYPEHNELFKNYRYEIQRCDALRYLLLHRYGGWYADMDYYCCKPLDEAHATFTHTFYLVQSPNSSLGQEKDHVSNSLMYSVANHPFWKRLMIELEINKETPYYYTKHLAVMFTTGPGLLNRVYSKYKYQFKLKSLPYKLFHPFGLKDDKLSLNLPGVYAIHIGKGSWEEKDSKFFITVFRNWPFILFIIAGLCLPIVYSVVFGRTKNRENSIPVLEQILDEPKTSDEVDLSIRTVSQ
jgi:mannosyltransferase OCH1-like enzyme